MDRNWWWHNGRIVLADGGEEDDGEDEIGSGDEEFDDGEDEEDGDGEGEEEDDEPVEVDRSDRPEVNPLAVEDELEVVGDPGDAGFALTINGINITGAVEVTMYGEGYESQYLKEVQAGGSDGGEYWPDEEGGGGSDSGGEGGESSGDPEWSGDAEGEGEEPPLHIEVTGFVSQQTAEQLVELRDLDDTFMVEAFGNTYEEMELRDFTRTLTGDSPYAYDVSIKIVEWREVEVEDQGDPLDEYRPGDGDGSGGSEEDSDPAEDAEELESGTPDDPNVEQMDDGEQREFRVDDGEDAGNVIFDTSSPDSGAVVYPRGDDWTARDMGWRSEENRSGIAARGSGKIANIYLGHKGDSGIVMEDARQVEVRDVNIQNSENGLHIVEGGVGDLAK